MTDPATMRPHGIAPEWLFAYLSNVAGGKSIRAVARARGVHASTILRQVRRVEDMRETPEWDSILDAMSVEFERSTNPLSVLSDPCGFALVSLGVKLCEYVSALAAIRKYTRRPGATLVVSEERAAVVWGLEVVHRVDRNVALAVLAHGLSPPKNTTAQRSGNMPRLEITPRRTRCCAFASATPI